MSLRTSPPLAIEVGLTAAIVAMAGDQPMILTAGGGEGSENTIALPSGPFNPVEHRTFEIGLRAWVARQTGTQIGYVEQLYTFGDRGRHARQGDLDPHVVSVGYLALGGRGCVPQAGSTPQSGFQPWYRFFPWEDWRKGRPAILDAAIVPALARWAGGDRPRMERVARLFGQNAFDEENVLGRYELLYEAGLVEEVRRDERPNVPESPGLARLGEPMRFDHRRILATAMGRLRAKMKYRPVIFELMPEVFTLTALQNTVEAISGRLLHKQNFRRLLEASQVAEPVLGAMAATGGRPAALFRLRRDLGAELPGVGLRVGGRG